MERRRDTIRELQADQRIYGHCCHCEVAFPMRRALLFYADEAPPEKVVKIRKAKEEEIMERRQELGESRKRARESERRAIDVNLGKVLEKIAPVFQGFGYSRRDCRALFEPIDYVVFKGLSRSGEVDALAFVDIKTGGGGLNTHQRQIRDAVGSGKVAWETYSLEGRP